MRVVSVILAITLFGCVEGEPELSSESQSVVTEDVQALWCNGQCNEGHDKAQCLCEKRIGAPDSDPASWIQCYAVPCCTQPTQECGTRESDVIWDANAMPGGALPAGRPVDPAGWRFCTTWDDYYYHCQNCMGGEDPGFCNAPHCGYLDDTGCWMAPGQTTCTYYSPGGTQHPGTVDIAPGTCVRSNETGFWSSASWWSFWTGVVGVPQETCTLDWQTPWDDTGQNERCNSEG